VTSIAVLGPGGVGGFVAAALARAGEDVTVVAHEATAERLTAQGLRVRSVRFGDFTAHPRAATRLREQVAVLIVATKATGLHDALGRIERDPALVVPLLNGLDHIGVLRERFGPERVAAGTIRVESDRPAPALIVQTSPFLRIELADDDPAVARRLAPLAAVLERAGIPARIGRSEAQVMWSKLVRLTALACTTSASDRRIGFIREDPGWRGLLWGCIIEAAAVAAADGAEIDPAATMAELEDAHPELGSSMQRDIAAGREPELDAIAGSVLRAAARHGLKCPTITHLTAEIADRAGAPHPAI
jgi:2-dehydropantoate 2-reductase